MFYIDLDDYQILTLLEVIAQHHAVLFMQDEDNSHIEELINKYLESLTRVKKEHIFYKVFNEVGKWQIT